MINVFQSVQSFVQFLLNWKLKGGGLVDQATANARASICVSCHNNKSSKEVRKACCGGGAAANTALYAARKLIIQNKVTPSDKQLLVCAICSCDLRIKVWIPNSALVEPEDANAFPTFCWVKKIAESKEL
jgi:hypothetical protein